MELRKRIHRWLGGETERPQMTRKEQRLAKYCLNYAFHRKTVHNSKGVSHIDLDE